MFRIPLRSLWAQVSQISLEYTYWCDGSEFGLYIVCTSKSCSFFPPTDYIEASSSPLKWDTYKMHLLKFI